MGLNAILAARRALLERIPEEYRGRVWDLLLKAAQKAPTPEAVLPAAVVGPRWAHTGDARPQPAQRALLEAWKHHPEVAEEAARAAWAWWGLPEEERARYEAEREARKRAYRERYLEGLPPTPAQLAYLKALGYTGEEPKTRLEASRLIEILKGGAA